MHYILLGCTLLLVSARSYGAPSDYISRVAPTLHEVVTNRAAMSRGVQITPIGVGAKSLHPHGEFQFRLQINKSLYIDRQCSSVIELKVHDKDFNLEYAEIIDLNKVREIDRLITIQRPNHLVLFAGALDKYCAKKRPVGNTEVVAFEVNKIYRDIVVNQTR